jgi:outer membrane immunogenic protein
MLVKTLIGLTAIAALAAMPAFAADTGAAAPPPDPAHADSWTGFYVGALAGYGFGDNKSTFSGFDAGDTPPAQSPNGRGVVAGGEAGYNYQFGQFVGGVEGDLSYTDMRDRATGVSTFGVVQSVKQNINWLGTVRARLGAVPIDRLLLFADGGAAFGGVSVSSNLNPGVNCAATSCGSGSASGTKVGWTAGAGAEYALSDQFSLKAEYLFVDLGRKSVTYPVTLAVSQSTTSSQFQAHIIRFGLNYRFGVSSPPPVTPVVAAPPAPPPVAAVPARQMFIVFFEFDKSSLTPDGAKVVEAAAAAFKSGRSGVAIAGYTDLAGTAQYNLALSKRRADIVKAALVKEGVPASAIDESWHGKENPRVPTADGVREPQNRRVEITM